MSDTSVELVQVSKVFNHTAKEQAQNYAEEVAAVQEINLSIKAGEFFTLLGPSGCGKTTPLRLIAGFEEPSSGVVYIQGKAMNHVPPYHRPVNTVFQNYALFPHLSVEQNVAFGLTIKPVPAHEKEERTRQALALVRLQGMEKRKPSQLSGGQQQRVALARALVNRPSVLLLDEPLGALDLKLRKQMQLELKQLQAQVGITFIYVTHDQEEALTMSDRIAVMEQGRVLQVDSPIHIYENPATRFVAEFIGETNFLAARLGEVHNGQVSLLVGGTRVDLKRSGISHLEELLLHREKITLTIRPEKFKMQRTPVNNVFTETANGHLSFTGLVSASVYIGTDTRYKVQLDSGETLSVQLRNISTPLAAPDETSAFKNGDLVKVWCRAEDLRAFAED